MPASRASVYQRLADVLAWVYCDEEAGAKVSLFELEQLSVCLLAMRRSPGQRAGPQRLASRPYVRRPASRQRYPAAPVPEGMPRGRRL